MHSHSPRLLLVDDRPENVDSWCSDFDKAGFEVATVSSASDAIRFIERNRVDLLVSDVCMPSGVEGIELARELKTLNRSLKCILYTAFGRAEEEELAFQAGVEDYVVLSTFDRNPAQALVNVARTAIDGLQTDLLLPLAGRGKQRFVAVSGAMSELVRGVNRMAVEDTPVLIMGETGTGKELIARALHLGSGRARGPFEVVNCGAIPDGLAEATFFGHAKGAFTGSHEHKAGLIQAADGGTLFLDEVGELPELMQALLLRFLESGEFRELGDSRVRHSDVRVVAATNRRLDQEAAVGRFRHDLFWRLAREVCHVPPLRDRPEDIPDLVRNWCAGHGELPYQVTTDAMERLLDYGWPGNVRELQSVLGRASRWAFQRTIQLRDVERALQIDDGPRSGNRATPPSTMTSETTLNSENSDHSDPTQSEEAQRGRVEQALIASRYRIGRAAISLGISRSTLYRLMKRFGLDG